MLTYDQHRVHGQCLAAAAERLCNGSVRLHPELLLAVAPLVHRPGAVQCRADQVSWRRLAVPQALLAVGRQRSLVHVAADDFEPWLVPLASHRPACEEPVAHVNGMGWHPINARCVRRGGWGVSLIYEPANHTVVISASFGFRSAVVAPAAAGSARGRRY